MSKGIYAPLTHTTGFDEKSMHSRHLTESPKDGSGQAALQKMASEPRR